MDFQAYGIPLEAVLEFKYLGMVLTDSDDDWPVVVGNLRKARRRWAWISRIVGQKGEDARKYRNFYKAVLQATLMFGEETWVMLPRIGRNLGGSHHRVDHQLENMQPRRDMTGRWFYPPVEKAMPAVGMEEVETIVLRRQNTITQYITTRPIL